MATRLIRRIITESGPVEVVANTFGGFAEVVTAGGGFLRLKLPDDICALRNALGEALPGPCPAQERADRVAWIEDVRRRLRLVTMQPPPQKTPTVTVTRYFTAKQQVALDTFRDFLRAADVAMATEDICTDARCEVITSLTHGDSAAARAARDAVGHALVVATVEGEGDPAFAAAYADSNQGEHISAADLGREIAWEPVAAEQYGSRR